MATLGNKSLQASPGSRGGPAFLAEGAHTRPDVISPRPQSTPTIGGLLMYTVPTCVHDANFISSLKSQNQKNQDGVAICSSCI